MFLSLTLKCATHPTQILCRWAKTRTSEILLEVQNDSRRLWREILVCQTNIFSGFRKSRAKFRSNGNNSLSKFRLEFYCSEILLIMLFQKIFIPSNGRLFFLRTPPGKSSLASYFHLIFGAFETFPPLCRLCGHRYTPHYFGGIGRPSRAVAE